MDDSSSATFAKGEKVSPQLQTFETELMSRSPLLEFHELYP